MRLFEVLHNAQQNHGIRFDDFSRYQKFCTHKLARLRKAMKLLSGQATTGKPNKKSTKKSQPSYQSAVLPSPSEDIRVLEIYAFSAERAYYQSRELLQIADTVTNSVASIRHHGLRRLKKALNEAAVLVGFTDKFPDSFDSPLKEEIIAYHAMLKGEYLVPTAIRKKPR
jgi:RNA-binding signal recognition particle 68